MIQLQSTFIIILLILKGGQTADIKSLECDFTVDLCEWKDPASVVWDIGDYDKSSFGQPVKEVADGGFINVQVPYTNDYLLESEIIDEDVEPFCIYFNYYMFGPLTGSLTLQTVDIKTEGSQSIKIEERVWKREGSQYDDWILGKYHVSPTKGKGDFILQFIATSENIALGPIRVKSGSCDYNNDCDFEDASLCFWTVEPDYRSNFRWFISDGKDSGKDLVGFDATTETATGHFMRTPKEGNVGSKSSINPTIYLGQNEAKCLSFFFYKSSDNSDILEIEARNTFSPENMIWSSYSVAITKQWIPININLNPLNNDYFKVSIKADRGTVSATPIAIDELKVNPEPCIPIGSCNFNSGLCNYSIKKGKLLVGFGRLEDQNTIKWDPMKNVDPYDLFVYTETTKTDGLTEYSLESPIIVPGLSTCLTFSYGLSFNKQASFSINLIPIDTKIPITIWTMDTKVSQESWQTIELPKSLTDYTMKPFKLSFDFNGNQLFMSIDDILIHPCADGHSDKPDKSCYNYDGAVNDSCIDIVPSSYNNWQFMHTKELRQKVTPIFNAGDDQVLAFDLSVPSRTKSNSYFYISNLKPYTPYCLKFWYMIDGDLKLNLWKDNLKDDFDEYLIIQPWYSFNNHFGLNWDQAKIQINDVNPETMIIFGASYTPDSTGTIIIDGINLIEGECSLNYEYFCDFEDDHCIWNNFLDGKLAVTGMGNVYEAKTRWIKILAKGRLPSRDSSLKSIEGHYLTLESAKGDEAIFTFPPIYLNDTISDLCLSLAINPISTNKLDIVIEQSGIVTLVETSSSPKGYSWLPFETSLRFNPSLAKMVHVYLVGSGSLAIDDLSIKMGSCSSQEFTCNDGKKISSSQVCDHKPDCSKGEDEVKCGDCDFSDDFCGYQHDDDAKWSIKSGQAVVESKFSSFWGSKSSGLTSPPLRPTSPTCRLQFEYKNRASINQLKVLLLFQDGRDTEIWDDDMVSVVKDDIVQIDLGRIPIPFNIQFYAKISIAFFESQPLSFDSIKMINCGYGDTVSDSTTESYSCKNGYRIALDQVCDSSLDCADGDDEVDCDQVKMYSFEDRDAPLYWIDLKQEKVKWSYETASGSIRYTPPRDHSRGLSDSAYMAVYPVKDLLTPLTITKEISLVGPELENVNGCSMVFYYNTAGVSLTVSILNSTDIIDLMKIPTSSSFGFKRQRVTVKQSDIQGRFNFIFKAIYSQEELSSYNKPYYAVVDDIVVDSSCFSDKPRDPTSKCTTNEYHCKKDNICIPEANICNYHSDCSDNSDEQNCGPCKFNQSLCGWTNEGEDYWVLVNDYSGDVTKTNVPITNKPEYFIIPDRRTSEIQSILKSTKLGSTSPVCKFSFKYFVRSYATLSIKIRDDRNFTSRVFEVLSSENEWTVREYLLDSLSYGYYIQFVLDIVTSDLLVELSPAGLADFQFINCNPAWEPSWLTSTIPTTTTEVTTNPPTTTTRATTHIITQPPTIPITTTKTVPTSPPTPATKPVTFKPETTPRHDIIVPTEAPITISPYENAKSNGVHIGSAPIVLLGIGTIVLVTIFAALLVKKRIYGQSYSPNGIIPLLESNFAGEEALDHAGPISFSNLQQSDEHNSID